jgi:hypothetical protein
MRVAEGPDVNIQFTSTLTTEDENLLAPGVLKSLCAILDLVPVAYSLRIETIDGHVFQHSRVGRSAAPGTASDVSDMPLPSPTKV